MKVMKLFVMSIVALFASNVQAQNITVDEISIPVKGTADLVIKIKAAKTPVNAEVHFKLPAGIDVAYDADEEDYIYEFGPILAKKNNNTSFDKSGNGEEYIFTILNSKNTAFQSAEGVLFTATLQAGDIATGKLEGGEISFVEIGDTEGKFAEYDGVKVPISITVVPAAGIRNITVDDLDNAKVYTVGGQRVEGKAAKKGVYVVNGKKVVVK
ncbi:MAG: hypothetical protein IJ614_04240 [Prevotella sp.]|nr:hypothetical protein [Prevotella sp.]